MLIGFVALFDDMCICWSYTVSYPSLAITPEPAMAHVLQTFFELNGEPS
jgi:hypothetical protein